MRLSYTIALLLGVATVNTYETEEVPTFADGTPVPEVIYDDEGNEMRLVGPPEWKPHQSGLPDYKVDLIPWEFWTRKDKMTKWGMNENNAYTLF